MNTEILKVLLIEVRVFDINERKEITRFLTPSVPRIGERFYVEYTHYDILEVRWTVIENLPKIDIFIDFEDRI